MVSVSVPTFSFNYSYFRLDYGIEHQSPEMRFLSTRKKRQPFRPLAMYLVSESFSSVQVSVTVIYTFTTRYFPLNSETGAYNTIS